MGSANEHLGFEYCANEEFIAPGCRDAAGAELRARIAVHLGETGVQGTGDGPGPARIEAQHLRGCALLRVTQVLDALQQFRMRRDPHDAVVVHVEIVRCRVQRHHVFER